MAKTIKSFFHSTTIDLPNKKAKIESLPTIDSNETKKETLSEIDKICWKPIVEMEDSWKIALTSEFSKPYFLGLVDFVNAESKSKVIYPPPNEIFTAFNLCPLNEVKVFYTVAHFY